MDSIAIKLRTLGQKRWHAFQAGPLEFVTGAALTTIGTVWVVINAPDGVRRVGAAVLFVCVLLQYVWKKRRTTVPSSGEVSASKLRTLGQKRWHAFQAGPLEFVTGAALTTIGTVWVVINAPDGVRRVGAAVLFVCVLLQYVWKKRRTTVPSSGEVSASKLNDTA